MAGPSSATMSVQSADIDTDTEIYASRNAQAFGSNVPEQDIYTSRTDYTFSADTGSTWSVGDESVTSAAAPHGPHEPYEYAIPPSSHVVPYRFYQESQGFGEPPSNVPYSYDTRAPQGGRQLTFEEPTETPPMAEHTFQSRQTVQPYDSSTLLSYADQQTYAAYYAPPTDEDNS